VILIRRVWSRCLVTAYLLAAPTRGASPVHSRTERQSSNRTTYSRFAWNTSVTARAAAMTCAKADLL
jgi:hypothetical protein